MPVAAVTSVLAAGFLPLFSAATAPDTTAKAADAWAAAYTNYIVAGGVPARPRKDIFASALLNAFRPELGGGGPPLFLQAFQAFWIGLPVPAQGGIVTAFVPTSTNVNSPQPDDATPANQANALALLISGLTLGAVKVTVPPGVIVPLL